MATHDSEQWTGEWDSALPDKDAPVPAPAEPPKLRPASDFCKDCDAMKRCEDQDRCWAYDRPLATTSLTN